MFTGLVEQLGTVISHDLLEKETSRLVVKAHMDGLIIGESVAVDGVCLTCVPGSNTENLVFDVSPETRQLTTLTALQNGAQVHIERAMLANSRLGGHYVSGHVDTTCRVLSKRWHGPCLEVSCGTLSPQTRLYVFPKGSITIAGVSLTVNEVKADAFSVMLIPHTLEKTRLGEMDIGQPVNIEFDYLARIVAHQLKWLSPAG
ncbi:MAG: riboflavin synthase [Gammaproteobacteria bacterium]|nr:riboflavin synthase [Gammaproteobacteria bacterium]